jgi:hypothetical protein
MMNLDDVMIIFSAIINPLAFADAVAVVAAYGGGVLLPSSV